MRLTSNPLNRLKMLRSDSLFGKSDSALAETPKVDLKDFLKFMDVCEKIQYTGSDEDALIFTKFKDLICDLNKTSLTGSAVLNFRLGKPTDSNDIDFFIEDDSKGINKAIVESFFICPFYKEAFKKFSEKYLDSKNKRNINMARGLFEKTSFEDTYSLIKLDYKIETFRFGFSSMRKYGFNLNFIFPTRLTKAERGIANVAGKLTTSLYKDYFIGKEEKLRLRMMAIFPQGNSGYQAAISNDEMTILQEVYPQGLPLHIINDSFDFEELKYVYSFELQQTVSTFIAAKMLLTRFKNDAIKLCTDSFISEKAMDYTCAKIDEFIINLEARNKKFASLTSDPNVLTLAKTIMPEGAYNGIGQCVHMHLTGSSLESIFGDMNSAIVSNSVIQSHKAYHNIINRVPKYQKRGFQINDPDNFIADLQTFINIHTLYIMQKPEINNIAKRTSLLLGDRKSTQKIKLLRESYKAYKTVTESVGVRIEADESEKEKAYGDLIDEL